MQRRSAVLDDVARQSAIVTAAELQVIAEEARAAALANPRAVDLDAIVRIQGAADRALRRLGVQGRASPGQDAGSRELFASRKQAAQE